MQIIVSNTNLNALYKGADKVLKKYGEEAKFSVPENIKGQSTLLVLKSMFSSDSFSICSLRDMTELHQIEMSDEHWKWMRTLHCVKFNDMHEDTKAYLFAILVEYFKPVISMSYAENI